MEPAKNKARITREGGELGIAIPSTLRLSTVLFCGAWLVAWAFGEKSALKSLFRDPGQGFMYLWIAGWTLAGLGAFVTILWNLFGSEVVTVSPSSVKIRKKIMFFGKGSEYPLSEIKNLRIYTDPPNPKQVGEGKLGFDFRDRIILFAPDIDKAEAEHILDLLKDRGVRTT